MIRKVLLILIPVFTALLLFFIYTPVIIPDIIFGPVFFLTIGSGIVYFSVTKNYYNWNLFFVFLTILAIIFKSHRLPFSGAFFTIGFTGLTCISFFSGVNFATRFKHNTFLRYIGFASSVILIVVSMGLLWKNMHWPGATYVLYVGLVLFVPFLLAFVFTLPNSNYINWNNRDRDIFFKVIIIPMLYVYVICVLMIVFPDIWNNITRAQVTPFYMVDFDLLNKPGLLQ